MNEIVIKGGNQYDELETSLSNELQELEKQRQLEQELRNIKSDVEIKRWEKVDVAVQTHYFDIAA